MMKILKTLLHLLIAGVLTVITQIGGIVYLVSLVMCRPIDRRIGNRARRRFAKAAAFIAFYCLATFVIVPIAARPFGRVPLPVIEKNGLKPFGIMTCVLNRHYVRPELKRAIMEASREMAVRYPGMAVNYLDANFPFINNFPMLPHLSHNDGRKLDLSFCYVDSRTGERTNSVPGIFGYGICEEPLPGETDMPRQCADKGFKQYNRLKELTPQWGRERYSFDAERTKSLVVLLASDGSVGKIFIEPHLKERMRITSGKVRFHGCNAVRHDDHIHFQLK